MSATLQQWCLMIIYFFFWKLFYLLKKMDNWWLLLMLFLSPLDPLLGSTKFVFSVVTECSCYLRLEKKLTYFSRHAFKTRRDTIPI